MLRGKPKRTTNTNRVLKSYHASPERSGNPLEIKAYFFLGFSSDGRSSLKFQRKKGFDERDCNEARE